MGPPGNPDGLGSPARCAATAEGGVQVGGDGTPRARGRHGAPDALHGTRRPGRARGPGRKCVLGHVWGCQSPGGGTDLGHTPLRQHPRPAGLPPWWQDPPRSTALVPGAAAPAGPEPQPHRSGPAACCGAGGRGQAQEAAVSGLPGSAEGGGRGLTYPAASSASTKSLSLPGSQKGSSWAPSRPCPCCRALRAKDAALWSAEGHTRGGQCRPQGPGSLWKPA